MALVLSLEAENDFQNGKIFPLPRLVLHRRRQRLLHRRDVQEDRRRNDGKERAAGNGSG